jgi:signal transduction histidine kinase
MLDVNGHPAGCDGERALVGARVLRVRAPEVRAALGGLLREPDLDVVLAVAAFAALLIDPLAGHKVKGVTPLAAVLAAVTALPLVARRRHPLAVLATVVPLLLACLGVFHPDRAAAAVVMLAVFTVGRYGRRSRSLIVGVAMAPVVAAGVLVTGLAGGSVGAAVPEAVAYLALILGALAVGDAIRARQELLRVLAEEEKREREALARHRFDEQRLRLAHELHDVVGHALVAINVRAAAAAHLARRQQPDSPVTVLDEIASTSAEALGELRAALKGLRNGQDEGAALRPAAAGLDDLPELIAGVSGAGLTVDLDMAPVPEGVPPRIAHAGYRIVQEGLTNVLRHSAAGHAHVRIGRDAAILVVEVADDGPAGGAAALTGGGHGLQGMRERAAALDGVCEAGQVPGGGWRIRARLPIGAQDG